MALITPETLKDFKDDINACIEAADKDSKNAVLVERIMKYYHSPDSKWLALLPRELQTRIVEAAKPKKPTPRTVSLDFPGYACTSTVRGTFNVAEHEYDASDGWKSSLTEAQQCEEFHQIIKVECSRTQETVLEVVIEAFFDSEVKDEHVIAFTLDSLDIEVRWIQHPIDHAPVAQEFLSILTAAKVDDVVYEILDEMNYVEDATLADGPDIDVRIRVPPYHGRKRAASQSDNANKRSS